MKNTILFIVLFCLLCNMVNAEHIKRLSGNPKPRLTAAEVRKLEETKSEKHTVEGYVSVKTIVDCFDEMSYQYTGGRYQDQEIKFRLRSPNVIKPDKKYPLVIWFHGVGESDDDNERQLAHMQNTIEYLAGPKSLDFFVLATQCPKDNPSWTHSISEEGKGDAPITVLREIVDSFVKEFPIDSERISVFGLSGGGSAAWQFVSDSPEQFAGLVVCSSVPPNNLPMPNVNVWVFACTGDGGVSIEQVRTAVKEVNQHGGNAFLTEINSTDHDSWTVALNQKKVMAWMIAQRKHSLVSPPPGAVLEPKTWTQAFLYYGLPVCCMLLFIVLRRRHVK